ncbi:MAG: HEPN domain-containing protein [Candidatus Bipolaricaulia bacterium]
MSKDEQARRWSSAKAKRAAAELCFRHGFYSESITLSYYACYQAMWVAVGDPPAGLWRHGGLMNEFCRALRQQSPSLRKRLDKLYLYRIQGDYEARSLDVAEAQEGLDIADEVLRIIAQQVGLAL